MTLITVSRGCWFRRQTPQSGRGGWDGKGSGPAVSWEVVPGSAPAKRNPAYAGKKSDTTGQKRMTILCASVGDPDPHVFGPPGSGSINQTCGSGSKFFSFLIKVSSRLF